MKKLAVIALFALTACTSTASGQEEPDVPPSERQDQSAQDDPIAFFQGESESTEQSTQQEQDRSHQRDRPPRGFNYEPGALEEWAREPMRPQDSAAASARPRELEVVSGWEYEQELDPQLQLIYQGRVGGVERICGDYAALFYAGDNIRHGLVVDLRSGEKVGSVVGMESPFCEQGYMIIGSNSNHLSTVDLESGEWRDISMRMPDGVSPHRAMLTPIERLDGEVQEFFVMIYRRGDAPRQVGFWQPGEPEVVMQTSSFYAVRQARHMGERIRVHSATRGFTSAVYDVTSDGIEEVFRGTRSRAHLLAGGWAVVPDYQGANIISPSGDKREVRGSECSQRLRLLAAYPDPAAALFSCASQRDGYEFYKYWTPDETTTWSRQRYYERDENPLSRTMQAARPIVDHRTAGSYEPTGFWFDMRAGHYLFGAELLPAWNGHGPANKSSIFATNKAMVDGEHGDDVYLYHVDIDDRTEQLLYVYEDCPGYLEVADQHPEGVILHCAIKSADLFQFRKIWSEFINLTDGTWWRSENPEILRFTDDGRLLVTDRRYDENFQFYPANRVWVTEEAVVSPR